MQRNLNRITALLAVVLAAAGVGYCAAEKGDAVTDPSQAGIDYKLQGEYAGSLKLEDGEKKFGAQVIALGDGKFDLVGYMGGLPGAGWSRGDETKKASGELSGEKAVFKIEEATIEVDGAKLSVIVEGKTLGTLDKTERKSPTQGAKPPEGAVVLFDGSSVEGWENGKFVEGNLLGATNCATKEKFGDHTLHLEFCTPFMPKARGQGRGNSGVYVQGRFEVQVLDSFGLSGANNECGGIYSISEPQVNMCFPPLSWQTYDIDFTAARYDDEGKKVKNARVTIRHNGVVIHDDIELTKGTPGRHPEGPEDDALFLQDHGNPVAFQNIWAVKK